MRLLDVDTGEFVVFSDPTSVSYAILSHTWASEGEQTYQDVLQIQKSYRLDRRSSSVAPAISPNALPSSSTHVVSTTIIPPALATIEGGSAVPSFWEDERLSSKVRDACAAARTDGYRYIWVDSCCIDKTSSSELSEAINSMFRWYQGAALCYVFLTDVPNGNVENPAATDSAFRRCKWFTRGWTLQELIAPQEVLFLSHENNVIGSKESLAGLVAEITGIDRAVLTHKKSLHEVSVATRMSWAARRETTRVEDRAYSLFGIFGVKIMMNTLYGEGALAFWRLQLRILEQIPDQSILTWTSKDTPYLELPLRDLTNNLPSQRIEDDYHGISLQNHAVPSLFPPSPEYFEGSADVHPIPHDVFLTRLGVVITGTKSLIPRYSSSPYGVRARFPLLELLPCLPPSTVRENAQPDARWYLAILACESSDRKEEHLLARVCYIPNSQSGIEYLHPGYLRIEREEVFESAGTVVLFPSQLSQRRHHLHVKTVYIPHRDVQTQDATIPGELKPEAFLREDNTQLRLSRWAKALLETQGYVVCIEDARPDQTSSCRIVLSRNGRRHIIHCWVGERGEWDVLVPLNVEVTSESISPPDTVAAASPSHDRTTVLKSTSFRGRERQVAFDDLKVWEYDPVTGVKMDVFLRIISEHMSKSHIAVHVKVVDQIDILDSPRSDRQTAEEASVEDDLNRHHDQQGEALSEYNDMHTEQGDVADMQSWDPQEEDEAAAEQQVLRRSQTW